MYDAVLYVCMCMLVWVAITGRGWNAMRNCNNCGFHLITLPGVYQGGKCSIEMNAVRLLSPPPARFAV